MTDRVCVGCGGVNRHELRCPVTVADMDPTKVEFTQSSLRPPPPNREGRLGVKRQSASSATTYTTKNRGRGCALAVPPQVMKTGQTMTREEYLHWRDDA